MAEPTSAQMERAALISARVQGCTCDVAVDVIRDPFNGVYFAQIYHDADCPLLVRLTSA